MRRSKVSLEFPRFVRLRSLVLPVVAALGAVATAAAGQGTWSNGDRNGSNASIGWLHVRQVTSSQVTPALAASNEVHLVDVVSSGVFRDLAWSNADGWKAPVLLTLPPGGPAPSSGTGRRLVAPTPAAGPGLAYRGGGIFDLVVRGSDQYYHAYLAPGAGWSGWEPIGGWGGDPSVTTTSVNGSEVLDVWVQAQGSIWRCRWSSNAWQAWDEIGHPPGTALVTSPGVVVRSGGTIDIVAGAAGDGQLFHAYFSPAGQLSAWESIPGKTLSKPALTSTAATRLDLWVRGASDRVLYHSVWDADAVPADWSGFEMSVNAPPISTGPGTGGPSFATGLAAVVAGGVTTIAAVDLDGRLLARSWVASVPAGATVSPTTKITRSFEIGSAENSVVVVPPSAGAFGQSAGKIGDPLVAKGAEYADGSVIYSVGKSSELMRVSFACTFSGIGLTPPGTLGVCPATQVFAISPGTGSMDSQIVRLTDGKLVWLSQNGDVTVPVVTGCKGGSISRGTESVRVSEDRGKTWALAATLDPCFGAPFDTSVTCNTNAVSDSSCWPGGKTQLSGADRPELLASTFDDSIYMTVGIFGTTIQNLHVLRSNGSSLGSWQDLDTGLQSGGAVTMAETGTYLYFARAEYGSPSNAGLYRMAKGAALTKNNFEFVGNLADYEVAGNVQLSLTNDAAGDLIFCWAYQTDRGGIRRGFSKLTPGGLVTLMTDHYIPFLRDRVALPTLVASPTISKRAFLYWYEGTADGTYSVKGAMSDGVGRWSAPVTLGGPWPGSATFTALGLPGNDYLKGAYLTGQDTFLATWLQPDPGGATNRIGQAAVK